MIIANLPQARATASACSEILSLPLRDRSWRGAAGEFQGNGVGTSMDFQDHRTYVPGDDPRHINWQAFARTGSYTMKLYREEVRPMIDIVLDTSPSIFFDEEKATRALELFHLTHACATKAGASTSHHLIDGNTSTLINPQSIATDRFFDHAPTHQPDQPAVPAFHSIRLRPNTVRIIISDCLFPADPFPILRSLTQGKSSVIFIAPYTLAESEPDWSGNYDFIDPETSTTQPHRIEPTALARYQQNYTNHFNSWRNAATRLQSIFAKVSSHQDLISSLRPEAIKFGAFQLG